MRRGETGPRVRTKWCFDQRNYGAYAPPTFAYAFIKWEEFLPDPMNPFNTEVIDLAGVLSKKYVYDREINSIYWEWEFTSESDTGFIRLYSRGRGFELQPQNSIIITSGYWGTSYELQAEVPAVGNPNWDWVFQTNLGFEIKYFPTFWLPYFFTNGFRAATYPEVIFEGQDPYNTAPRFWLD